MSMPEVIERVECAPDAEELARILREAEGPEERLLEEYLGQERLRRLRRLASRTVRGPAGAAGGPVGNVIVLHGIMGGELTVGTPGQARLRQGGDQVWMHYLRMAFGAVGKLKLGPGGRAGADPKHEGYASGILKRYYGDTILRLGQMYRTRAFWYDWRRSLDEAADDLCGVIEREFSGQPVHLVAHSMGGLVARTFIKRHPDVWARLVARDADGRMVRGGRLVMLGTPNHGSFAIPQIITGLEPMVRKLATLDLRNSLAEIQQIVNTFPGSLQMLPSPLVRADLEPLYKASTYARLRAPVQVSQDMLSAALNHHQAIANVIDAERMVYVAGYDQPTLDNVVLAELDNPRAYAVTPKGDGRVPHELGLLKDVRTYYVRESHGSLQQNESVLAALPELLATGQTGSLSDRPVGIRALRAADADEWRERYIAEQEREVQEMGRMVRRVRRRAASRQAAALVRSGLDGAAAPVSTEAQLAAEATTAEQRAMEEAVVRGFLGGRFEAERPADREEPRSITIRVAVARIEDAADHPMAADAEAVAVGTYQNVRPQDAILALDRALSAALRAPSKGEGPEPREHLMLTQLIERGVLRGELGRPFLIPDPRPAEGIGRRMVAVAGMGVPGRFGPPELVVMVRELCWSLGRMGMSHLATVLIGSGAGNLTVSAAVEGWLAGIHAAVRGAGADFGQLRTVTFVEMNPQRAREIGDAIANATARYAAAGLQIELEREKEPKEPAAAARATAVAGAAPPNGNGEPPTRITLTRDGRTYRFGAITRSASIPERDVAIDPDLIAECQDLLVGESCSRKQLDRGRVLGRLLIPEDLNAELFKAPPLVMLLDATTARIPWEMVARGDLFPGESDGVGAASGFAYGGHFLSTRYGLTRQLRTAFAPPPEPPPPPVRRLRALIVADPAVDAPLPGARKEGERIAELLEAVNATGGPRTVEVKTLFGREATRPAVLEELLCDGPPYDLLHFSGHCYFDPQDPTRSGWIFSGGKRLSADELSRVDRVPSFVFSNACESGVTPERAGTHSPGMAPSFAEAFFARGVTNFVCTAWPVDDDAALQFALVLYQRLLGVDEDGAPRGQASCMYEAMCAAREAIAGTPAGAMTWGAYQHYGNPYFRFFDVGPTAAPDRGAGPKASAVTSESKWQDLATSMASREFGSAAAGGASATMDRPAERSPGAPRADGEAGNSRPRRRGRKGG